MNRLLTSALFFTVAAGLGATDAVAQATLVRSGGTLGDAVTYDLSGDPFELFVLLPSKNAGPTPLAILTPGDPRLLDVGIDLINLVQIGNLGATGSTSVVLPLPVNPALQGLAIYAQYFTAPGSPFFADDVSNFTAFKLGEAGTSVTAIESLDVRLAGQSQTTLDDGTVLIAGGAASDSAGNDLNGDRLYLFDPQTQGFELLGASLATDRAAHTATKLLDGRVLFAGGTNDTGAVVATAEIYDPVSQTVSAAAAMGVARVGHTATLLVDGRVYTTGGIIALDPNDPLAAINSLTPNTQVYSPVSNAWSNGPNLPNPRTGHNATRLADGRVLVTGGVEVSGLFLPLPSFSNDCRLYNPVNNTLTNTGDFGDNRALHSQLTLSDGRVMVAGGSDGNLILQTFFSRDSVWVYNPGTGGWTQGPNLGQPRSFGNLVEIAGVAHLIGGLGSVDPLSISGTPIVNIEAADIVTGLWTVAGQVAALRPVTTSTLIEGGARVFSTGGVTDGSANPLNDNSGEIFLP